MMLSGTSSRREDRVALVRRTAAKEYSYWPTPAAKEMWPTPRAREGNAGKPGSAASIHNMEKGYLVGIVQEMYPTPAARDYKDVGQNTNYENLKKKSKLAGAVGGQLNPAWVEWLMGFPPGWTDLGASGTPSSRKSPDKSES